MKCPISDLIKGGNETIKELSTKINMDISQTKLFLKYYQKFDILSSILDSKYVNYFNQTCLTDLRENDEITDENFAKSIVLFVEEKRKHKNWYFLSLQTQNDIKMEILILSKLDSKSFRYSIPYNEDLDLLKNLEIFNYLSYIDDNYVFDILTKKIIEKKIESPMINCVNIDEISLDEILIYSKNYPNRIKYIDFNNLEEYAK